MCAFLVCRQQICHFDHFFLVAPVHPFDLVLLPFFVALGRIEHHADFFDWRSNATVAIRQGTEELVDSIGQVDARVNVELLLIWQVLGGAVVNRLVIGLIAASLLKRQVQSPANRTLGKVGYKLLEFGAYPMMQPCLKHFDSVRIRGHALLTLQIKQNHINLFHRRIPPHHRR